MIRRLVVILFTLIAPVVARSQELDRYGGWKDVPLRASGAFRIEEIGGRELLVTPDGHPFLAIGINHLGAIKSHGNSEPDLFATRYQNSWSKYADEVLGNFEQWGLNTVDNTVALLCESKPYFAAADFVKTAKYYGNPGEANPYEFPDVFDIAVQRRLEHSVAEFCSKHVQNGNLIAYYWTDTPTWDLHKTRRFRQTDWVSEIRRLPAGTAGRKRYGEFLCQQYEDSIDRFSSRRGASKLGLLRDDGTPYQLLVEATRRASAEVRESIHAELVGFNKGFSQSD